MENTSIVKTLAYSSFSYTGHLQIADFALDLRSSFSVLPIRFAAVLGHTIPFFQIFDTMQRFYVTFPLEESLVIDDEKLYHQMARVLRMQKGDKVGFFCGE